MMRHLKVKFINRSKYMPKKKTYSAEFYPICCTSVQIAIIRFKKSRAKCTSVKNQKGPMQC